jgi:phenylacetate-coenzyme A ligase PaaK-like adenylate-forming protein
MAKGKQVWATRTVKVPRSDESIRSSSWNAGPTRRILSVKAWTQRLYFATPVWAQNVLANVYGARLRHLRYGDAQRRLLDQLIAGECAPHDVVHRAQLEALRSVVAHAYATVPLYQDRNIGRDVRIEALSDLRSLPLLRKDDLRQPKERTISSHYRGKRLQTIHTGGTTGKPLTIYCDRSALQRNYAFYSRLLAWAGIGRDDRIAVFAGRTIVAPTQSKPPYWRTNRAGHALLFSSYHISSSTLPDYVAALERFAPALIDSYPSSVGAIARFLLQQRITTIRPRAIVTSSETLLDGVRREIETAFACPVFDHYGGAEMAAFISQCERGRYHVNPEFGVVEILRDGVPARAGEMGEIIATGFVNRVMPLVRYATGDLAEADGSPCPCGRAFPTVARIVGRLDDTIVTPDGRMIGRLDPIFKAGSTVRESRIVQDAVDHVRLEIVPEGNLPDRERDDLLRELAARLGPTMRIDLVAVAGIPRTASGKLRTVVNEVSRRA